MAPSNTLLIGHISADYSQFLARGPVLYYCTIILEWPYSYVVQTCRIHVIGFLPATPLELKASSNSVLSASAPIGGSTRSTANQNGAIFFENLNGLNRPYCVNRL